MTSPSSPPAHRTLLYVDPNPERARELQRWLPPGNVDVIFASGYMAAVTALARQPVDLLLTSHSLPEGNGLELLRIARREQAQLVGALMLDPGELRNAVASLRDEGWEWLTRDESGAFLQLLPMLVEKWLGAGEQSAREAQWQVRLAESQSLAELAAESCGHGLAIFGSDLRLKLCNAGFLAHFDYPAGFGVAGTPLRDMLRFNLQRGDYGRNADADEVDRRLRRLGNGRNFRLEQPSRAGKPTTVEGRHLPDGSLVMRYIGADSVSAREEEQAQAQQDGLTGLPNAVLFRALLRHQVQRGSRSGYNGAALFLLELAGLGALAERQGAEGVEALFRETARKLSRVVRECDVVARLEGDRFGILLIDVNTQENAEIVAGKLLRTMASVFNESGMETQLSCSLGVAFQPTELLNDTQLMELAENGVAQAKVSGKNHYKIA
ncbi:diguanylate cyclase domain-containing protein [Noviherbaspirillum pedocola]|uniref:Diguanylate cyclase n=1 Tax=Noviherbaspirillum pedocola TaxID=2801341 RepID=A0A934VZJ9_9BURK|nr:diguanylate cyclase [Noviherbaspirillum pedocola]MBK4733091.1 diguanylate cyclase [Noviherbaspirillum pedocola]